MRKGRSRKFLATVLAVASLVAMILSLKVQPVFSTADAPTCSRYDDYGQCAAYSGALWFADPFEFSACIIWMGTGDAADGYTCTAWNAATPTPAPTPDGSEGED